MSVGAVLVLPTAEQRQDRDVERCLRLLSLITRVLDLQEYERVRDEFRALHHLPLDADAEARV